MGQRYTIWRQNLFYRSFISRRGAEHTERKRPQRTLRLCVKIVLVPQWYIITPYGEGWRKISIIGEMMGEAEEHRRSTMFWLHIYHRKKPAAAFCDP